MSTNAGAISGLQLTHSGNVLAIGQGYCRDAQDTDYITVPAGTQVVIDPSLAGIGGLDTGAGLGADKTYAVFVIRNGGNIVGGILSEALDASQVQVPISNMLHRRVGTVVTNDKAEVIAFTQTGSAQDRKYSFNAPLAELNVLTNGDQTVFTTIPLLPLMPDHADRAETYLQPTGGQLDVRQTGAQGVQMTATSDVIWEFSPSSGAGQMDYKVQAGTASISVLSFTERV